MKADFTLAPEFTSAVEFGGKSSSLPIVVTHGMGDSCFNPGMKQITKLTGTRLNTYSTCIPTGDNQVMDTIHGFLMTMDKSVDIFAEKVRKDPKLKNGFHALGLSQGNNLVRGYIQKYNDPPVHTYISINSINAGVAAFPQCAPTIPLIGKVCEAITEVCAAAANTALMQSILFQVNYFRDPKFIKTEGYLKHNELAKWNGETGADMTQAKANWAKTAKTVWIRGTKDTEVWPNEGEQWGQAPDDYPKSLKATPMKETKWYTEDLFGLKTADLAGKLAFEEYAGNHLRFTMTELNGWLDKYFTD